MFITGSLRIQPHLKTFLHHPLKPQGPINRQVSRAKIPLKRNNNGVN